MLKKSAPWSFPHATAHEKKIKKTDNVWEGRTTREDNFVTPTGFGIVAKNGRKERE